MSETRAFKINFTEMMLNINVMAGNCTMCYDLLGSVIARPVCRACKGKGKAALPLTELFTKENLQRVYRLM